MQADEWEGDVRHVMRSMATAMLMKVVPSHAVKPMLARVWWGRVKGRGGVDGLGVSTE